MRAAGRTNRDTGTRGEQAAENFLKSRGYRIVKKNYRSLLGEIDLIARHAGLTVFVEVKTRYTNNFGPPLSSITWQKEKHIIRNCLCYLKRYGLLNTPCRIDVIGIKLAPDDSVETLEHVRDAIRM
jgi:putative endonuclease